jgi:hypothetical protein
MLLFTERFIGDLGMLFCSTDELCRICLRGRLLRAIRKLAKIDRLNNFILIDNYNMY